MERASKSPAHPISTPPTPTTPLFEAVNSYRAGLAPATTSPASAVPLSTRRSSETGPGVGRPRDHDQEADDEEGAVESGLGSPRTSASRGFGGREEDRVLRRLDNGSSGGARLAGGNALSWIGSITLRVGHRRHLGRPSRARSHAGGRKSRSRRQPHSRSRWRALEGLDGGPGAGCGWSRAPRGPRVRYVASTARKGSSFLLRQVGRPRRCRHGPRCNPTAAPPPTAGHLSKSGRYRPGGWRTS